MPADHANATGYLCMMLHAHLPYVRHPEYPEFLEEDWFYEAVSETYIPLLLMLDGFERDGVNACFTMSLTPPLCEMLADPLLQGRYENKLRKLTELTEKELKRTLGTEFESASKMYKKHFADCLATFERWGHNLVNGFRHYQNKGFIEVITCGATHGFLPLMVTESAVRAQIQIAVTNYKKHFGRAPRGIWLPECAYAPGIDKHLQEAGIEFFFMDTHGIVFGSPRPRFGPFRPVYSPAGVAAFARDAESSRQVWSSEEGYPGDVDYREFYRDIGYDGDFPYIKPYLHNDGVRRNVGMKYHRITGKVGLNEKAAYMPAWATEKAAQHAANFMHNRVKQANWLKGALGAEACIVAPYDAELFGHWWFEGPQFLNYMMRKIAYDQSDIALTTPPRFLEKFPKQQIIEPSASSWGDKGYYEVWLNNGNDWIYRHLHAAEVHMQELANTFVTPNELEERALKQAARELLLAQSSDWAFIITTGTMVAYAEKRTKDHLHRFNGLYLQLMESRIEEPWLADLEWRDNIFSEVDWTIYR
ncbi:MAG: 1,4-alpha-glucan branching protein domain-containing protein [Planctomycetota bacterium]